MTRIFTIKEKIMASSFLQKWREEGARIRRKIMDRNEFLSYIIEDLTAALS